jgi:hypothetical protein
MTCTRGFRVNGRLSRLIFKQQWFLAVRKRNPTAEFSYLDPANYTVLECPLGEFRADPFLLERDGEIWIFFERYRYLEAKGEIACARLGSPAVDTILVRPYHLSYPHILEWDGCLWMLPETVENRTVELYRCHSFPAEWKLETRLLCDVEASDPTLIRHDNLFWLFASNSPTGAQRHRLNLWYSSSLCGPWAEHPANPIVQATCGARPGGAIFSAGEHLIRPAQDCSSGYGSGLQFRRIVALNANGYVDEPVGSLHGSQFPGWTGVHTYSRSQNYEAVDGCVRRFDLPGKLQGLTGKSLRAFHRRDRAGNSARSL